MQKKKVSAKQLPQSLTDDKKVISAMKSIQSAGFWAFAIAILCPIILVLSLASGNEPTSSTFAFPVIAVYLAYSGWKMNKLEGTSSLVIMLIINILLGLLLVAGILPILMVITSIIALVKIKIFLQWKKGGTIKLKTGELPIRKKNLNVR